MSDVFEGPGWWMASDGKWYSPERHPDPSYRTRFTKIEPAVEFPSVELDVDEPAQSERAEQVSPFSEMTRSVADEETSEITSEELQHELAEVERQRQAEADAEALAEAEAAAAAVAATAPSLERDEAAAPSFSVAARDLSPSPSERPIFDIQPPASVVEAPTGSDAVARGRLELEVDRAVSSPRSGPTTSKLNLGSPTPSPSTSTSLVHVPGATYGGASKFDRALASLLFVAGVAMIVGTFLTWTDGAVAQTGWDRGDGFFTIVAGVLGSAAAGPIFVGFRHIIPKFVAIVAGLVGLVVIGLVAIGAVLDEVESTTLGLGFAVVLAASIVMVGAGLADRGDLYS